MKQSDIITVILVAGIGIFAAILLCNMILGNPDERSVTFKTVQVVDATLASPDPEVFNQDAINPTVEIYVGNCEDLDQDGVLSEGERIICGWATQKDSEIQQIVGQ